MNLDICSIISLNMVKTEYRPRTINVINRNYNSISYRLSGENTIIAGKNIYKCDTGAATYIPAGIPYVHHIHTPSESIVVHFITTEQIGKDICVIKDFHEHSAEKLFTSLYDTWKKKPVENSLSCMVEFYNILDIWAKIINKSGENTEYKQLEKTVDYIYSKYRDSSFHIKDLHNMAYVSETYYRRMFRRVYGCSPINFLKQLRLNYAMGLLKSGCYSIAEVSQLSGFTSTAYFSYAFKHMTGYSPTEFVALPYNNKIEFRVSTYQHIKTIGQQV